MRARFTIAERCTRAKRDRVEPLLQRSQRLAQQMHPATHVQLHVVVRALDPVDRRHGDEVRAADLADRQPRHALAGRRRRTAGHGVQGEDVSAGFYNSGRLFQFGVADTARDRNPLERVTHCRTAVAGARSASCHATHRSARKRFTVARTAARCTRFAGHSGCVRREMRLPLVVQLAIRAAAPHERDADQIADRLRFHVVRRALAAPRTALRHAHVFRDAARTQRAGAPSAAIRRRMRRGDARARRRRTPARHTARTRAPRRPPCRARSRPRTTPATAPRAGRVATAAAPRARCPRRARRAATTTPDAGRSAPASARPSRIPASMPRRRACRASAPARRRSRGSRAAVRPRPWTASSSTDSSQRASRP